MNKAVLVRWKAVGAATSVLGRVRSVEGKDAALFPVGGGRTSLYKNGVLQ